MNKPTLLYDARAITPKPCGVRNVAENYLHEFQNKYNVIAIVNADVDYLIPPSVKKVISSRHLTRFNPLSDFWISLLVIKYRPEVFFSAHSFIPVFAYLPKNRVFICHDLFAIFDTKFFNKRGFLAPIARLYFRVLAELSFWRASVVVAPSDSIRQTFSNLLIKSKKTTTVNNGIALSDEFLASKARIKQVLFVGNFRSYKGSDILFDAWSRFTLTEGAENWSLVVVTNEPESVILDLKQSNNRLSGVSFYSRIDDVELDRIRKQSSIFIVPSRQEGFGIPLLESIASGGIVICSDIPVFRELLKDFDTTFISTFESENSEHLSTVLIRLASQLDASDYKRGLEDSNLTNLAVIRDKYSWKAASDKVMEVLQ